MLLLGLATGAPTRVGTKDGLGMGDAEAVVVDQNRTWAAGMRRADINENDSEL